MQNDNQLPDLGYLAAGNPVPPSVSVMLNMGFPSLLNSKLSNSLERWRNLQRKSCTGTRFCSATECRATLAGRLGNLPHTSESTAFSYLCPFNGTHPSREKSFTVSCAKLRNTIVADIMSRACRSTSTFTPADLTGPSCCPANNSICSLSLNNRGSIDLPPVRSGSRESTTGLTRK